MNKHFAFVSLSLFSATLLIASPVQATPLVAVRPLLADNAMVVDALIPFEITVTDPRFQIVELALIGSTPDVCRIMRDPFRLNIQLLKCRKPVPNLQIKISVSQPGEAQTYFYGCPAGSECPPDKTLSVKPAIDGLVAVHDGDSGEEDTDINMPLYQLGQSTFATFCVSCHRHETPGTVLPDLGKSLKAYNPSKTYLVDTIIRGNKKEMGTTNGAKAAYDAGNLNVDSLVYYIRNYKEGR